jgi:hypothetical protein
LFLSIVHVGVGVEAAFEVEHLREAGPDQRPGDVGAAGPVVADDDRLRSRVELRVAVRQLREREEVGSLYAGLNSSTFREGRCSQKFATAKIVHMRDALVFAGWHHGNW